jgi:hypothetical protein
MSEVQKTAEQIMGDARDLLQAKIRRDIISYMPDEAWQLLLQSEIRQFTTKRLTRDNYGRDVETVSPLQGLIQKEIHNIYLELIKAELAKPEWWHSTTTSPGMLPVSDVVKQIIRENIPLIVESAIGSMFQMMIHKFSQSLR